MTHILVVEHGSDTRALRGALEREGYQVTVASDGQAAQAFAGQATEPLVVLLDEGTPPLRGNDLLVLLQELSAGRVQRQFLLLAEHPEQVPAPFQGAQMQRLVHVVGKSPDSAGVRAAVAAAAAQLTKPASGGAGTPEDCPPPPTVAAV